MTITKRKHLEKDDSEKGKDNSKKVKIGKWWFWKGRIRNKTVLDRGNLKMTILESKNLKIDNHDQEKYEKQVGKGKIRKMTILQGENLKWKILKRKNVRGQTRKEISEKYNYKEEKSANL